MKPILTEHPILTAEEAGRQLSDAAFPGDVIDQRGLQAIIAGLTREMGRKKAKTAVMNLGSEVLGDMMSQ